MRVCSTIYRLLTNWQSQLMGPRLSAQSIAIRLFYWLFALYCMFMTVSACAQSPPVGTIITNRAIATYSDLGGNPSPPAEAQVSTRVSGGPNLKITNTASPTLVEIGDTLSYTIRYLNDGNSTASNVSVVSQLSDEVSFISASGSGSYDAITHQVTWLFSEVLADNFGVLTIDSLVEDFSPGANSTAQPIINIATIDTVDTDIGAGNSATALAFRGQGADFSILKIVDRQTTFPGGILNYTINIANTGNENGTNTLIDDTLPVGVELLQNSVNLPFTLNGRLLEMQAGDLAPGESVTALFSVQVSPLAEENQVITNSAIVRATGTTSRSSNSVSSVVLKGLNLDTTGESIPVSIFPGDNIRYKLSVENIGDEVTTNLKIRQPLPPNTSLVSVENDGEFINGEAVWNITSLAQGDLVEVFWEVASDVNITPNSILSAPAYVLAEGLPEIVLDIATLIFSRTIGVIEFFDETFTSPQPAYFLGETHFQVQVTDFDRNLDSNAIETITVTLSNNEAAINNPTLSAQADVEVAVLTETGEDTGVFRVSFPFNFDVAVSGDNTLFVTPGTRICALYEDPLDSVGILMELAVYQPASTIFNSATGEVITDTEVRLLNENGSPAQFVDDSSHIFISDENGQVLFPELEIGSGESLNLIIEVIPPNSSNLNFPSVVPDESLAPTLSTGADTKFGEGSRGEVFNLTSDSPFISFDIPLDATGGTLRVEKKSAQSELAVGEIIRYEISITNTGAIPVNNIQLLDLPPRQFRYFEGSSTGIEGSLPDPTFSSGQFLWVLGSLDGGESIQLNYQMMVGVDATNGNYTNTAYASGDSFGVTLTSNTSRHKVRVREGIFTRNGTVIGRVFVDLNNNAHFDPSEPGLSDTIIIMEDGSYITTDTYGRYSFRNVTPGQHVLRLDTSSLPSNMTPNGRSANFMNRTDSQWLDMHASGLLKANFPVSPVSDDAREQFIQSLQEKKLLVEDITPKNDEVEETHDIDQSLEIHKKELEALVKTLEAKLSFINLKDNQQLPGFHTDIQLTYPLGSRVEVLLNGNAIDPSRLAAEIQYSPNNVSFQEYIAVKLQPNIENILEARLYDNFGNLRKNHQVKLYTMASVESIALAISDTEPIADGRTLIPVQATLINTRGNPASHINLVSVDARPATIVEDDADPVTAGHQLRVIDGIAQFTLKSPRQPGETTLKVRSNDIIAEQTIIYTPHLHSLMIVGSGDLAVGSGSTSGDIGHIDNVFDDQIEDGAFTSGKAAVFVKGAIGENTLLTATYDSSKKEQEDFFQARETDVDDESLPLITGDASLTDYAGYSRDKLYLRLDQDESHVMWGDYHTDLGKQQLSFYNRTFTGLRADINQEKYRITGFAAEMEQDQIVDAIAANGTSGYYYLSRNPVLSGSERVVLETRDRLRPDLVLSSTTLARQTDYDIDYEEGSILTRAPIPTYDEALNPNILIVTYEIENLANDQWAYGARVTMDIRDDLTLGGTAVIEENSIDDFKLHGVDAEWRIEDLGLVVKADLSETEAVISNEGTLGSEKGSAWRATFEGNPNEKLSYGGYYQDVDKFFHNSSAVDAQPGTVQYGANADYALDEVSGLTFDAYQEDDQLFDNEFSHIAAGWQGVMNQFQLSAEIYHDKFDGDKNASNSPADDDTQDERYPFDSTAEQVSQDLGVRLTASRNFTEDVGLSVSHSQDVQNTDQSISYARLNYAFSEKSSMYLIERYDRYEDRDEWRSQLGFERPIGYNTTSFTEYQLEDDISGKQLRRSIGLRNMFQLNSQFSGNASFENLDTISGDEGSNRPDGYAVTVATTYLPDKNWQVTSRAEYRNETDLTSQLGELGVATKLGKDLSALARVRFFDSEGERGSSEDYRVSLGMAWRPQQYDRLNGLARLDWWQQDRSSDTNQYSEDKLYGSVEAIYDLTEKVSLTGKYAGKKYELDQYSAYNDLVSLRAIYQPTSRIELGATTRFMQEHEFSNQSFGGAVDVGFQVWKFIWLTVGYSYDEFDADLTGQDYSGKGGFLKFRFKFDEKTLEDIRSK
ncbi:MAG: hypothetical protein V7699_03125 [Porticoccus sp.]